MNIYRWPGWLYDAIYLILTLGLEGKKIKVPALRALEIQPGQTVVDWGCGTGLLLQAIADELRRGAIIAIDRSARHLQRAQSRRAPRFDGRCSFTVSDGVSALEAVEPVDAVIASYSLGVTTPEECEKALTAIAALLKPGGKLLIIDQYHPSTTSLAKKTYYGLSAWGAARLFRQDFSGTVLREARRRFEELRYEESPALLAFFWVGKKRQALAQA